MDKIVTLFLAKKAKKHTLCARTCLYSPTKGHVLPVAPPLHPGCRPKEKIEVLTVFGDLDDCTVLFLY